jgi:hypothetical protein
MELGFRFDDAISCGVQMAGESTNCEDGVDCENSVNCKDDSDVGVVGYCESSESVGVGLLIEGR